MAEGKPRLSAELKNVLTDFSETTSAHGPPKIVGHKYVIAKVFWVLLFLTGIAVFGYFSFKLITAYMKFESTTDVQLKFSILDFPAVSFCNLNQFRKDRLPPDIKDLVKEFIAERRYEMFGGEEYYDEYFNENPTLTPLEIPFWQSTTASGVSKGNGSGSSNSTSGRRKRRSLKKISEQKQAIFDDLKDFYEPSSDKSKLKWFSNVGKIAADKTILLNLTYFLSNYTSDKELRSYGHDIEEMLQECAFQGETCGPENFYQFYDRRYGNCYTFNSGLIGSYARITSPGASFGLSLTLFINQHMYMPGLSPQSGAKILLHKQGEVPQIAEEGFNVAPGLKSSIAVRYVEIERLKGKVYSNCTVVDERPDDGSLHSYYPGSYTKQACLKTCIQKATIQECGCANALYRAPSGARTCGIDQYSCVEAMELALIDGDNCTKSCPLPCSESQYHHTIASSQWPANNYEPYLKQSLRTRGGSLKRLLDDKQGDSIKEDFVSVDIYFDNLNYYLYKERASMTFEDLIGNLGGHLGLWIGMSVISFVEVFELIVALFGVCAKMMCSRQIAATS